MMQLSATGLSCVRGGREVFRNLDFSVDAGEALAVTGRNGAGKSSLLRLIAGLLPRQNGSICFEPGAADLTLAEQSHFLGHRDAVKPSLTVLENLTFWRDFLGGDAPGVSPDAGLEAVGIAHLADLPAAFLSAGQRRRLAFARLLVTHRPLWLLDEPASALDSAAQSAIAELMASHLRNGGLIVAATHEPLGIPARELRIGGAE